MTTRDAVSSVLLGATLALVACGGDTEGGTPPSTTSVAAPTTSPPATTSVGTTAAAPDVRVVALGEEFVLADLLALGITPVASTATVPEAGFQGLGELDAEGIDVLSATEPDLERLAALQPDVIVTIELVADELGRDRLDAIADVVVVPDDATATEQLLTLGEVFDRSTDAAAIAAELDAARADLQAAVESTGCNVSVATIYPGPSVAAWVDGTSDIPAAMVDAGCTLVPDGSATSPDDNGRAFLSLEQLELLGAPQLVLLQSTLVEGESDAVARLEDDPLWTRLPAVAAGRVRTIDRLGYAGALGERRLLRDLRSVLAG